MNAARDRGVSRDAEARRLAQTEFETPLVIEAGAGTGKTALLVARLVAWCIGPGWAKHAEGREPAAVARRVVERVVAITFTAAAAAEMAARVADALSSLAGGETPVGVDRRLIDADDGELTIRASLLADEIHRLQAQTIHSYCHHLLRAYPLEAGVHPRFEVDSDGSRTDEVVVDAVTECLHDLAEGEAFADWEILAAAGITPPEIADAASGIVAAGIPPDRFRTDPCSPDELAAMTAGLIRAIGAMGDAGVGALSGARGTAGLVWPALDRMRCELMESNDAIVLADALERIPEPIIKRLGLWVKGDFNATEQGLLPDPAAVTDASAGLHGLLTALRGFSPVELRAAFGVLATVTGMVDGQLTRSGVLGFNALLGLAASMLESSDAVRFEVRAGIDQLMVDEFQDTDVTQCRLVRSLALSDAEPRPGLFIVGDPKQSIYGWRRADLGAYDRFTSEVQQAGGRVEPLVQNFRSSQVILDEVERLVEPVMARKEGIQPSFQRLEATEERVHSAGFTDGGRAPVEYWVGRPLSEEADGLVPDVRVVEALAIEATAVAGDIRGLIENGMAEPEDIAVLVRSTTSLEPLLDALRSAGVPFEVTREREYYRRREVVETAALVRAVIEPADQLALLTVLRSDAVGVPDAALAPLWDAGLPGIVGRCGDWDGPQHDELDSCVRRALAAIPAGLPGADAVRRWPAALQTAVRIVGLLRSSIAADPPDVFVERLRTLWLAEATASARYQGRFRRARLERFFAELTSALASDDGSLAAVARLLRRAVDEGGEPNAPVEPDTSADAVHVMTIHGAKGLDFEHVYLCQIHKGDPGVVSSSTVDLVPSSDGVELKVFGWPTPGYGAAARRRRERDLAERVRLLYVAATRAKQRLVVSGRWRSDGGLIPAARARSFEDLVAHRLSPDEIDAQAIEGLWRRAERPRPVHWVVPSINPDRDAVAGDTTGGDRPSYDLGRVRRDAGLLAACRSEAEERSTHALTQPASSLADERSEIVPHAGSAADRSAAAAAGTAIHRLMETLDLDAALRRQVESRRAEVLAWAAAEADRDAENARRRAAEILDALLQGGCLDRLEQRRSGVVARELPVIVPATGADPAIAAIVGVVDLIYEQNGRLVVADYKTDDVSGGETAAHAERYRPQLELYARALEDALELDYTPTMELWFLRADQIVTL